VATHAHPLDPDWPSALVDQLRQTHGALSSVERLGGMSGGRVWRVRFKDASVIVKASASPAEARFYEHAADTLRLAGVPSPRLELALHEPDAHWLLLEDIPTSLPIQPPTSWRPDAPSIAILARLHAVTRAQPPNLSDARPQNWTDAMTFAALTLFPPRLPLRSRRYCGSCSRKASPSSRRGAGFRAIPTRSTGGSAPMARLCCLTGNYSAPAHQRLILPSSSQV